MDLNQSTLVLQLPKPYCPAELSIFLGLRFLSNYYPLLRQNAPWNWTSACAAAVHRSLYVLVHFDLLSLNRQRLNRQPSPCQSYGWQRHPVLTQLHSFISEDWPTRVLEKPGPFHRLGSDLASWNNICVARGLCTVVQSALRELVLAMVHEGHLDIVKIKQRCRGLVWWQGIGRDVETMVRPYLTFYSIYSPSGNVNHATFNKIFLLRPEARFELQQVHDRICIPKCIEVGM